MNYSLTGDDSFAKKLKRFALIASITGMLAACGGGSDGTGVPAVSVKEPDVVSPKDPAQPVVTPAADTATLTGQVTNNQTNAPVADAEVRSGDRRATTDADGRFTLGEVAQAARTVVEVTAAGFSAGFRTTALGADGAVVNVRLQPVDVTQTVDAASDSVVTIPGSPGRLSLTANSLVKPDGSPASGSIEVSLTAIQPALDVNAMPGDYRVASPGGPSGIMESFGAMAIDLRDADGNKLNLGAGQTAVLRIPLSTRHPSPAATIPLFYFDEVTGYWREEGSATLAGSANAQYYEGTVSHFSYWNADQLMNTVQVNGCLRDESGSKLANARVFSDGIDYSGSSWAMSDANGQFSLPIKRAGRAIISAQTGRLFSNSLTAGPSETDFGLSGDCLTLTTDTQAISIKLTWGERPRDADSHLYAPDGSHVYFANDGSLVNPPYANLDVDDTGSFGPEVVTIRKLMVGTYTYGVNNYSGPAGSMTTSPIRVELSQGSSISSYSPGAGETGNTWFWTAFTLTVSDNCSVAVTPVNTWSRSAPSLPASVPARYCTAP
ncbi:hypothetical protein QTI33_03490 [Variovorax sp. J22P271]|uniref:hypothetical protein n=1 Tax=Variovorax davisae TaxID=3053515 RepID=UPI002575EFBE|nr:hypothetical protein [Variovorax sp. J22P271]MDM0031198.1 hypothetical protein [Variovorax sp. J22P271]